MKLKAPWRWLCFAFIVGFLGTVFTVSNFQIVEEQRYATLKGDMTLLRNVRNRIVHNPNKIDVAFIGTSHTLAGVADEAIQAELMRYGVNATVANLGTTWMGRDLHLFLARKLLLNKTPQLLVIEINEHESPSSHGAMPYVANLSDMVCCKPYLDPQFLKHYLLFLKQQVINKMRYLLQQNSTYSPINVSNYGWIPSDRNYAFASTEHFKDPKITSFKSKAKDIIYENASYYGLGVLENIVRLAHEHNVNVVFLYLPEYNYVKHPIALAKKYEKLAPIIKIPENYGNKPEFWADIAHLNSYGATNLAPFIASEIRKYIRE